MGGGVDPNPKTWRKENQTPRQGEKISENKQEAGANSCISIPQEKTKQKEIRKAMNGKNADLDALNISQRN